MWATGRAIVAHSGGTALSQQRAHVVAALRTLGITFGQLQITWVGDAYRVDGTGLLGSIFTRAENILTSEEGEQCLEWLPEAGLAELHLFQEGGDLRPVLHVVPAAPAGGKVMDFVTWILERRGVIWFRPCRPRWRGDGVHAERLAELISVILTNFPALLTRTFDSATVRLVASPKDHPITALMPSGGVLEVTTSTTHTDRIADLSGHLALEKSLVRLAEPDVQIQHVHPHPSFSRKVCLWLAGRRRPHRRKHYKRYVQYAAIRRGVGKVTARADCWKGASEHAANGLAKLEWKRVRMILGLGVWGEQVLYRLKAGAFSMYDVRHERLGCPHAQCVHEVAVDIHHVFWTCPAARTLRKVFTAPWKRLGLETMNEELACFSLELPAVPSAMWDQAATSTIATGSHDTGLDICITALAEGCWGLGAALYFHAVWRWRVQHFDETSDVSAVRHKLLLTSRLRQGYATMQFYVDPNGLRRQLVTAASIVNKALRQPWHGSHQEVRLSAEDSCYLLFFDGGSRGNPGPGGSGAVVVRMSTRDDPFQLVWAGSMSYAARTTTNNVAEYMGLLVGLSACCRLRFTPLHVVGDSAMIIRQQLKRVPPKAKHLTPLYWRCRRQLAGITVLSWQHHLRAYDKMADTLANMAMDSRRSMQARLDTLQLQTERWRPLVGIAGGDVGHWTLNNIDVDSERATAVVP